MVPAPGAHRAPVRSGGHGPLAARREINSLELDTTCYMVNGTTFEVSRRYKILEPVGQGAYGIVCAAQDEVKNEPIAIKKIENAFEHITFTKRTLRELRILRHLRHENLISVRNLFVAGTKSEFEDMYVISELMETDLSTILKSPQPLTPDHCQFFLYQILRGLKYVHSAQVIHRDLKPRNLLVNANCDLKICDFGLARVSFVAGEFQCPMTEYVCTRWYRAPEVLCSWTDYGKAIDIWSVGCIFAEMLTRKPIFPGHNTPHQLQLVIDFLGTPGEQEMLRIQNSKCRRFIEALPRKDGQSFEEAFADAPPLTARLIQNMLGFDPTRRYTTLEALQDEYLEALYCPEDEPTRGPLDTSDFEFERRKITASALREEIFCEALYYYPDLLEEFERELNESGLRHDISKYRLLVPGESQYSSDEDADAD
mmetsp:Transcript_54166/g.154304  ORF Transcript_54166/g.154304 Transcript_54166/m.154304 type:complete len:426 (+) Transcript_54166:23-1300(+)